MLSQLPEQADPCRLCEQVKHFEGAVALRKLGRLTPLLTSDEGEAAFALEFDQDDEHRKRIQGRVKAVLPVICQRCLQPMSLVVDSRFQLSPVSGHLEAERLPEEYDPLLLESAVIHPLDLIEDELILAIPPAPRHSAEECGVNLAEYRQEPEPQPEVATGADNPFAALAHLKRDDENK